MSILKPTDFNGGEQTIANLANGGNRQNLQVFIDEYEFQFLVQLLGFNLAKAFTDGLNVDPVEEKWSDLSNEVKSMLKCYIYYWYIRNQVSTTTGTGEVKAENENSSVVSAGEKMSRAWNKMSDKARLFNLDLTVYPEYEKPYWNRFYKWFNGCGVSDIYFPINTMNI